MDGKTEWWKQGRMIGFCFWDWHRETFWSYSVCQVLYYVRLEVNGLLIYLSTTPDCCVKGHYWWRRWMGMVCTSFLFFSPPLHDLTLLCLLLLETAHITLGVRTKLKPDNSDMFLKGVRMDSCHPMCSHIICERCVRLSISSCTSHCISSNHDFCWQLTLRQPHSVSHTLLVRLPSKVLNTQRWARTHAQTFSRYKRGFC